MILAVDPGTKALGWAMFDRDGRLVRAGCSRTRARSLDRQIEDHARVLPRAARAVVEMMEHRPGDRRSNPRDLLAVQAVACSAAGIASALVTLLPPSRWKGSIPKDVHHKRLLATLEPRERAIVDQALGEVVKSHHKEVLDAIGIGLYDLKRTNRSGCARS